MRPILKWFGNMMERRLSRFDDTKKGWDELSPNHLYTLLSNNYLLLSGNLLGSRGVVDHDKVIECCIDMANYAMMIADLTYRDQQGMIEWGYKGVEWKDDYELR